MREARAAAVRVSPHLGGLVQSWTGLTGCAGWPIAPTNPQHPLRVRGNPPILFVNSRHDPATSYVWAAHVASVVPRSALLTYAGDGHASYLTSTRVSDTVTGTWSPRSCPPRAAVPVRPSDSSGPLVGRGSAAPPSAAAGSARVSAGVAVVG